MTSHLLPSRRQFLQGTAAAIALGCQSNLWAREAAPKQLAVLTESPFNAEARPADLVKSWITPLPYFYVRNHGPTPQLAEQSFRLSVDGMVHKPKIWSVGEIKELVKKHGMTIEATMTCAGNRRAEMSAVKKIGGVQWTLGAIGNATWTGVPLRVLLEASGVKAEAKHLWLEGVDPIKDKDGSEAPFGGSIPVAEGMELRSGLPGALVALEMNGQPLTPEHGFPLRLVVPGYIGARSVKWLAKISASDQPSTNHYLAHAYKLVQTESIAEAESKEPIYQFPINAAICVPASGKLPAGKLTLNGFALPPGDGSAVQSVEVSLDGGKSWGASTLHGSAKPFCWRLWSLAADLPAGKHTLIARATDSRRRVQPETCDWNAKGYLHNAWHRVEVEVV